MNSSTEHRDQAQDQEAIHSSSSVPSEGHMITRQADDEFLRSESPVTRHFLTTSVEVHSEHQPPSQLFSSLRLRKQKRSTGRVRLSLNTSAPATELITQISDEERSLAAVVTAEDNNGDDDISDDSNSNHEEFVSLVEESDTHRKLKQLTVSIRTKDAVRLTIGFGRGMAQIYWNQQTKDMSAREKKRFYQKERVSIQKSKAFKYKLVRRSLTKEIEQCEKEFQEYLKIFENAMKAGYVSVSNTSVLIAGPAGVGKTTLKHIIFRLPPPEVRNSTNLGEAPVCAVRKVSAECIRKYDTTWEQIKSKSLMSIVAETVYSIGHMMTTLPKKTQKQFREIVENAGSTYSNSENDFTESPSSSPKERTSSLPETISSLVANVHESFVDVVNKTKGDTPTELEDMEDASSVLGSNWIYFIDSGGQPHFHNLIPHFIQGISIILVVLRLCDRLDDYPVAYYYEDGKSIGSFKSPLTIEDTLRSLIRSMQSHSADNEKPKLMFIGTFLDKIDDCSEDLDEKNAKLYDMFSKECLEQLLFSDFSKNQLIFPINAANCGEEDERFVQFIRSEIDTAPTCRVDVPIWWYVLAVILEDISTKLDRKVLSKQECLEVALTLKFGEKELTAALKFFHNRHQLHYYPNILPDMVFTSSQVLLDKLTELVKEAYRLRGSADGRTGSSEIKLGGHKEFRDKGIITFGLLNQFQQHYADGIFTPEDLLKIFTELLILTQFSSQTETDITRAKFFMPSLLDMLPSSHLEKYRCPDKQVEPLVISFPSGSPRSGVFCCLQVHLMKAQQWELIHNFGEPEVIAQNCVMLSHPTIPCTITLIDSFSYIEVHVSPKHKNHKRALPLIREAILEGIQAANLALNYNIELPQKTFFCPCSQQSLDTPNVQDSPRNATCSSRSPQRHVGNLKEGNVLQCSLQQTEFFNLNERYTVWLGKVFSDCSSTSSFVLNVEDHLSPIRGAIHRARDQWLDIGRELHLQEHDLIEIRNDYTSDKECLYQMLRKWMQTGKATIEKLLEVLDNEIIGYRDLANEIRAYNPERRAQLGFQD